MTYHSLLVHLDNDRRAEARIAYALRVARELGCRIVGAAPTGSVPLDTQASIGTSASLADFADAVWMALDERAQAARERFEKACRKAGVESPESVVEHADKAQSLVRLSHCSDIVVLSQAEPDAPDFTGARDLVADVILQSARPSIVLPFVLGIGLAMAVRTQFGVPDRLLWPFALFVGLSLSITAFPVLVRIVDEHALSTTRLGTVAIACAALDDVTAWIVLALVTAFARADTASATASRMPRPNMSSARGRISAAAPGPSSPWSRTQSSSPRTIVTGRPASLVLTSSAAPAISSATAGAVTVSGFPNPSRPPARLCIGASPAHPIATST